MNEPFSFIFDIGGVLFTHSLSRDYNGVERVSFTPIEEGIALLHHCSVFARRKGSLVIACTNLKKHEIDLLYERFPSIVTLFKAIVSPAVASARKPDPAIFQYALDTYNLTPHRTLFFDDTKSNITVAGSLGIEGIFVESFPQVLRSVKQTIPDFEL